MSLVERCCMRPSLAEEEGWRVRGETCRLSWGVIWYDQSWGVRGETCRLSWGVRGWGLRSEGPEVQTFLRSAVICLNPNDDINLWKWEFKCLSAKTLFNYYSTNSYTWRNTIPQISIVEKTLLRNNYSKHRIWNMGGLTWRMSIYMYMFERNTWKSNSI